MTSSKNPNSASKVLQTMDQTLGSIQGNVMVYLIVVILIFGVLGVTIVSLFTTATSSSATPNDARRAHYVAESGVRYALSRIRNANFHPDFVAEINTMPGIADAIKSVESELGERGRVLVRYSGTQPLCRVMVEGPSETETRRYCQQLSDIIKKNIGRGGG